MSNSNGPVVVFLVTFTSFFCLFVDSEEIVSSPASQTNAKKIVIQQNWLAALSPKLLNVARAQCIGSRTDM